MRQILFGTSAVWFLLSTAAPPASAHHSFSAEFDADKCSEMTGILTKVDWENPHAYFYLDTKEADGQVVTKTFQTSSLSNMKRGGTTRQIFVENFGKTVSVRGCASRNGTDNRFAASWIKFPDGSVHRVGQDVEGFFGTRN